MSTGARIAEVTLMLARHLKEIRGRRKSVTDVFLAESVRVEMYGLSTYTLELIAQGISAQYDEMWSTQLWNRGAGKGDPTFDHLLEVVAVRGARNEKEMEERLEKALQLPLHEQVKLIVASTIDWNIWEEELKP